MSPGDARNAGQRGFTLMELLIVVAVGGVIAIPLLAWISLGLRSEESNRVRSAESTSANLVSHYLPLDLASSTSVANVGGVDCTGGTRSGGTPVLMMVRLVTSGTQVIVYTARDGGNGTGELVRRVCDSTGGPVTSETKMADGLVAPASGWPGVVTCADRPGRVADTCGQVTISVTFTSTRNATVRAERRAGEAM